MRKIISIDDLGEHPMKGKMFFVSRLHVQVGLETRVVSSYVESFEIRESKDPRTLRLERDNENLHRDVLPREISR